ncbi:Cytochrome c oxidase polypeptide IV [Operophtera brumata]|uniref:Cytochrome c oxidase polypeptide IV n=1 Tax=Operophtera brumata TaxID=104452 RepID=A0A0L7L8C7_OPEBR|nr:Cytochrome c oxidase polypeptide IV [Operophtera brumata]
MSVLSKKNVIFTLSPNVRYIYNRCRIGNRDWVGFGTNGCANYQDNPHFPFPAVRFKENTRDVCALREKERGDWKLLCCEEKKALYRASFCQTFAEFQCNTGQWKLILGFILISFTYSMWAMIYNHFYVYEPLPASFSKASQKAQLRRMLELRVNPITGLSSLWDYDNDRWKVAIVFALIGMAVANPVGLGYGTIATEASPPMDRRSRRIYNPDEMTKIEHHPSMAALLVNKELWCGAMLSVRVGSSNATSGGDVLRVSEIFFHPNYKPQTLEFNFAVLKLHKNLTFGKEQLSVDTIEYSRNNIVPHDAGGPAVMDGVLIGILSFSSKRCDQPDQPAVFSTIGAVAPWLETLGERSQKFQLRNTAIKI